VLGGVAAQTDAPLTGLIELQTPLRNTVSLHGLTAGRRSVYVLVAAKALAMAALSADVVRA
jgi:hypothetical protein